jgi:hypothetical protein
MSRFAKIGLLFVLFVFVIIVIVGISRRCRVDRAAPQWSRYVDGFLSQH